MLTAPNSTGLHEEEWKVEALPLWLPRDSEQRDDREAGKGDGEAGKPGFGATAPPWVAGD